jgi:hypothetical protein
MEETLYDLFVVYGVSVCLFAVRELCSTIIRQIKLNIKYRKLFKEGNKLTEGDIKNLPDKSFVILEGSANKIYERKTTYIDKSIILSESNTTYYEDFLLSGRFSPSCLIQPYQKTKLNNLQLRYLQKETYDSFLYKIVFTKSQTISNGDIVYVFGKVNKNTNDITSNMMKYVNVKPKAISGKSLGDLQNTCTSLYPIFTNCLQAITLTLFVYIGTLKLLPSIKKLLSRPRQRLRILCKDCNVNPCNILCEKCENLSEYCANCYIKLQDRINSDEILLENIKCPFCNGILDHVQKLFS